MMPFRGAARFHQGVDRREALKRIGTGAAVTWTAPIVLSLRTPSWAQYPDCPSCRPFDCVPPHPRCKDECLCIETVDGDCFCHPVRAVRERL